ncbi:protein adenylyltransferase SelO [Hyphococcus sp. DH-69]|uniref:protein adenylyltransferase SelO n=1 Tax=Hyphococcus formosus TaxID=3143534 RepID=UPI00398B69FA
MVENYHPDPVFVRLGDKNGAPFYDPVTAADFPETILRYRNQRWAERVGLGDLSEKAWLSHFGRFSPLPDNQSGPVAMRYHGHQFRSYNPDLGDGRGFLFAQLRDDHGRLLDLGTKGSGQTPYSRAGDGRLTLKGGVREILATEMLEALGVYTSKTFSLIETGEALMRDDEPSPTRSAVMVRLSHSHIRFGSFQRLAYEENYDAVRALVDYCVTHFYPHLSSTAGDERIVEFFKAVIANTAKLTAQWMAAGFVHGVLNTDNMNITGESFDYGPWRFIPTADPSFTAAYFDRTGLYSFGRQGEACAWNLAQLGGALSRVTDIDALNEALQTYPPNYEAAMADAFFARLGLLRTGDNDFSFVANFLRWLNETGAPYEQVFFDWFCGAASRKRPERSPIAELYVQDKFKDLGIALTSYDPDRPERLDHEYFAGSPTTMLIDEVEAIWAPIAESDDWSRLEQKISAIGSMREAYGFEASSYG